MGFCKMIGGSEISTEQLDEIFKYCALRDHPVKSFYASDDSTSPATLFGGTWVRVEGCFLFGADSTHAAGTTGGSETVTLSESQMPRHRHIETIGDNKAVAASGTYHTDNTVTGEYTANAGNGSFYELTTDYAGGGQPHNNMPPYRATYIWQRTA